MFAFLAGWYRTSKINYKLSEILEYRIDAIYTRKRKPWSTKIVSAKFFENVNQRKLCASKIWRYKVYTQ